MTKLTAEKRERFCSILADGSSVTAAAKAIDVSRASLYSARALDPEFAAAWDEAIESGTDTLEDGAVKRAKNSSDPLLMFLLKGRRPEKFKDRSAVDSTVKAEMKLTADWSKLSPEEAATMVRLVEKAKTGS